MKKLSEQSYAGLTEKDVRFLILVWRDGLLDTDKLSKKDRTFLAEANSPESEIMLNKDYLRSMEKRGLVTSLVTGGRLVFRANFTRASIFESLVYKRIQTDESENTILLDTLIELFHVYSDSTTTDITVPDNDRRMYF
jgi:hypothetical protein